MENVLKNSLSDSNLISGQLLDKDSMSISSHKSLNLTENASNKITAINRSLTYLDQIYEEIGSSFNIRYLYLFFVQNLLVLV